MSRFPCVAPQPRTHFPLLIGLVVLVTCLHLPRPAGATETENHSIRVLPAGAAVVVDGKADDWDLTGGVFTCGEVEHLRSQYAVWFHAMYDAQNIYLLARWVDPTPMNNPETIGGHGFNGDCLQVRFILYPDTPDKTVSWWTLWRDAKGVRVADRAWPGPNNGVSDNKIEDLPHAEEHGVKQAFAANPDGKGYVQEVAIPWKLLSVSGKAPAAGGKFKLTIEPNFTAGAFGRITIKDIFDENVKTPDRVFTFTAWRHWGWASLEAKGNAQPQPVRLADGRHFAVAMKDGVPAVDWAGLIRRFEWPGFAPVAFEMPFGGYVSLNILDKDGLVVRHLLNWDQRDAGRHTVQWDGLTDATFRTPGEPVPAGDYTWRAIAHPGAKVVFRGYASCGGKAPWIGSPDHFWLGDHGVPTAVIADADRMYLACNGAEGGHHLVATDFQGKWQWSLQNTSGGWDPEHIAVDGGTVFVLHPPGSKVDKGTVVLTRVDAKAGGYTAWQGRKNHILTAGDIWAGDEKGPTTFTGIAARDGVIYLATAGAAGRLLLLDGASGKPIKSWPLAEAGALCAQSKTSVLAICDGSEVVTIDPATGKTAALIKGLRSARGLTLDSQGRLYVSVGEPDMQVVVFGPQGQEVRRIGRQGGHPAIGPWQADGMIHPAGVAVDKEGKLWVMERYAHPKRVSVWDLKDGSLVRDFFGPAHYGASGAAINPRDPNLMVGEGCEWRLDPATGKSTCMGAFDAEYHNFATFREASNGRLYLITTRSNYGTGSMELWQRLGDGRYAMRVILSNAKRFNLSDDAAKADKGAGKTQLWTDLNGDGKEQPEEIQQRDGALYFAGSNSWSLNVGPDLTIYALDWKDKKLKALSVDGFTEGGVPRYDLAKLRTMPDAMSAGYERNMSCALPSADNKRILVNLAVKDHPARYLWHGFDLASGKLLWTYPNPYFQVHGSHQAPAPEPGLFRGAYGPVGAVNIPGAGCAWLINGNLGEWYALSADGFFLTRVFNGNVFEWKWPAEPTPGLDITDLPAGSGGEDFGGSATQGKDGKVYVQAGKYGIWNTELTGLEKTVPLAGGKLTIRQEDTGKALALRERALQTGAGARKVTARKMTVAFSGDLNADFKGGQIVEYQKSEDARVRTVLAHDDATLYVGWDVKDATPWVNGAKDFARMYAAGDTVDLQLGVDPAADQKRRQAAKGDLRLSIGNFQGKPTAVLYRFVADAKRPRLFDSGVIRGYQVDWVDVLAEAKVHVKVNKDGYVVEAAVPMAAIGLSVQPGLTLRGDVGVTHGDPAGVRTRLRTHWANQQTGLVDDVVFELQPAPQNWGQIVIE